MMYEYIDIFNREITIKLMIITIIERHVFAK